MQLSASKKLHGVCVLLKRRLLLYPSSRKSILTRAELKLDEVSFSTNVCGLHKKQWVQIHEAQDQRPQMSALKCMNKYIMLIFFWKRIQWELIPE